MRKCSLPEFIASEFSSEHVLLNLLNCKKAGLMSALLHYCLLKHQHPELSAVIVMPARGFSQSGLPIKRLQLLQELVSKGKVVGKVMYDPSMQQATSDDSSSGLTGIFQGVCAG